MKLRISFLFCHSFPVILEDLKHGLRCDFKIVSLDSGFLNHTVEESQQLLDISNVSR